MQNVFYKLKTPLIEHTKHTKLYITKREALYYIKLPRITKLFYIVTLNDFIDYDMRYVKVFYLKYIDVDGNDIEIKKYYDSFEKKLYDESKFNVDIEI